MSVRRFFVHTFGCQMNVHDSRRIEEVLLADGYLPAERAEAADVLVLNTCSVREKAEHKLTSAVGTLRPLKAQRPGMLLAIAGCMAQEHGAALLDRLDLVDVVIGPDNIRQLPALLHDAEAGAAPRALAELDYESPSFLGAGAGPARGDVTALVTVMKGCDERCSFCIVPHTRGAERYRPADDIVAEIAALVEAGVGEVTLLGQTVNSWHDPRESDAAGESRFAELLRRIAREVPALPRLRYTSPHPRHVTDALVRAHAELDVLPWHVHLPVQSGSDRVLKRMIRRYTHTNYVARARALRAARPGFTLSTDVIVGFPGETEHDFERTLELVEEVGFVAAFGFKYSPRPHTPALKLPDDVPEAVKARRLDRLFALVDRQQRAHLEALVGSETEVLVEGRSKSSPARFTGRSHRHEIVHLDVPAGYDPTGLCLRVRIVEANKRSLRAEPVDPLPERSRRAEPRRLAVVGP